ncbi:MAG: SelB C-terminal domain-containing protein, partial [Deltaproteobacteria bacterium]|nr:SelB C-terminal domain-containing protein [Deltaproteobacteria bacterium]
LSFDIGVNGKADEGITYADCRLSICPSLEHTIKNYRTLTLHHYTGECQASVRFFGKGSARGGETIYARVKPNAKMLLLRGDRFILRDPSIKKTVGGGKVLMPYFKSYDTPVFNKTDFDKLNKNDLRVVLNSVLDDRVGIDCSEAALTLNVSGDSISGIIDSAELVRVGDVLLKKQSYDSIVNIITSALESEYANNPGSKGVTEDAINSTVMVALKGTIRGITKKTLHYVINTVVLPELILKGTLKRLSTFYNLTSHSVNSGAVLSSDEEKAKAAIGTEMRPFKAEDIANKLGIDVKEATATLKKLKDKGVIERLKVDTFLSSSAISEAKKILTEYFRSSDTIKVAEFRDLLGVGRKLAIEILELFDRERITIRSGDERKLR